LVRVEHLLARALAGGVPTRALTVASPVDVPPRVLRLRLGRRVMAAVAMSQRQRPRPVETILAELLVAAVEAERDALLTPVTPAAPAARGSSGALARWRPEQAAWLEDLHGKLRSGDAPILLAEAATGLGKSRVLAALATSALTTATPEAPIVVAAPTVAVLQHLLAEADAFDRAALHAHAHVLLGRAQFVHPAALAAWCDDLPPAMLEREDTAGTLAAVRAWMAAGGPEVRDAPTTRLHATTPGLAWLAADLGTLAPTWPLAEFLLTDADDPNAGEDAYRAHQAAAREASWIFTTHAMLATDQHLAILRKAAAGARFPRIGLLLLDEAHQFDNIMADLVGHDVAVSRVLTDLRTIVAGSGRTTKALASSALAATGQLIDAARALPGAERLTIAPGTLRGTDPAWRALRTSLAIVVPLLTQLTTSGRRRLDAALRLRLTRAARALGHIARGAQWVALDRSAVRRWPSFAVGATTLRREYEALWAAVDRAVLVSATLALPTGYVGHGNRRGESYDLMAADILRIPRTRRVDVPPARPAWVTAGVSCTMPGASPAVRAALTPPKRRLIDRGAEDAARDMMAAGAYAPDGADDVSRLNKQQWWQSVAAVIAHRVRGTAAGGTLVLCGSYEDTQGLTEALARYDVPEADLLAHTPGVPLLEMRDRFLIRARAGGRPVWCATGSAWTGLDCRDVQAATPNEDHGLTDLVIPRVPWSLNRSLVHAARCRRNFAKYETADTALRLRQGLGRLVRQPGLQHRRVWMLDARCWNTEDARQRRLYAPMREVLGVYGQKLVLTTMPPTTLAVRITHEEGQTNG